MLQTPTGKASTAPEITETLNNQFKSVFTCDFLSRRMSANLAAHHYSLGANT